MISEVALSFQKSSSGTFIKQFNPDHSLLICDPFQYYSSVCIHIYLIAFSSVAYLSVWRLKYFYSLLNRNAPKRDEVTGEWRKLHSEELNDLCSSPNIVRVIKSRRMRWAEHIARVEERTGVYRALVGKSEGRRTLGWPRRRWEHNIKLDLQEVGCGGIDWIDLAQDRDRLGHLWMK